MADCRLYPIQIPWWRNADSGKPFRHEVEIAEYPNKLLAEKIETHEGFQQARDMVIDYLASFRTAQK